MEVLVVVESAVGNKNCSINHLRIAFTGRQYADGRAIVAMMDPPAMPIAETCGGHHLRRTGCNVHGQA